MPLTVTSSSRGIGDLLESIRSDDSVSYNEDSIMPLTVTSTSRGIGDLLESIRGGAKQLKKVEPDTQEVSNPFTFCSPLIWDFLAETIS